MYAKFRDQQNNYRAVPLGDKSYKVWHKLTEDVYHVSETFVCTYDGDGRPCWQQKYAGCLCVHALVVCVERLSHLQRHKDDQEQICHDAILQCNQNWHRNMYAGSLEFSSTPPPAVNAIDLFRPELSQDKLSMLKDRFTSIAAYMPSKDVEKFLTQLKDQGLSPRDEATATNQRTPSGPPQSLAVCHVAGGCHVAMSPHLYHVAMSPCRPNLSCRHVAMSPISAMSS